MRKCNYFVLALAVIIFVFVVYAGPAFGENVKCKLELINNKISIYAQEMPIGPLLKEIGDRTGIQFVIGEEELNATFSGNFQSLPLDEAFNCIFKNINHVIIYNSYGKILIVRTVNKGIAPSARLNTGIKKLQSEDKTSITRDADDMGATHGADDMNITYEPYDMDVF